MILWHNTCLYNRVKGGKMEKEKTLMKMKISTQPSYYCKDCILLLNNLKIRTAKLKTIITYDKEGYYIPPEKNRFAVIQIIKRNKEYRGTINICNKVIQ